MVWRLGRPRCAMRSASGVASCQLVGEDDATIAPRAGSCVASISSLRRRNFGPPARSALQAEALGELDVLAHLRPLAVDGGGDVGVGEGDDLGGEVAGVAGA